MSRQTSYLQRRGNALSFRIGVPPDLRSLVGARELVKALRVQDRRIAEPIALSLAAQAKQLFINLRGDMAKHKTPPNAFGYTIEYDISEFGAIKVKVDAQPDEQDEAIAFMQAVHPLHEATALRLRSQAVTLPAAPPQAQPNTSSPMLSALIHGYIESWPKSKPEMLKKHKTTLPMFLEFVGDMRVSAIRQSSHVNEFFKLIQKLPPRWKAECKRQNISVRQLALQEHQKVISADTFNGSYKASMQLFLTAAISDHQDEGFPTTLSVKGVNFGGGKGGQNKQRALTEDELKRLFEGIELRNFAAEAQAVHQFWLPVLGLFTGARVNELCQINPQTDIRLDPKTQIWCILLSNETDAGGGIVKTMKMDKSRAIPIHHKLIELGFVEYAGAIKKAGHRQLFPAWKPRGGRAGVNATKWFSRFLEDIGLHGVENENGRALRGMHCFRHTLLTTGKRQGANLRCISGHAERSDNPVADGYEDDTILITLANKQELLSKLDYGLTFPIPVLPA